MEKRTEVRPNSLTEEEARELIEQNRQYEELFQSLICGIMRFQLTEGGDITMVAANREAIRIFGYSQEGFWEKKDWSFEALAPNTDWKGLFFSEGQAGIKEGSDWLEVELIRKGGSMCWVLTRFELLDKGEYGLLVQSIFLDINLQKLTEQENLKLRQEKEGINEILRMALSGTKINEFFYYPLERYALLPERLYKAYGFAPRYDNLPQSFCDECVFEADHSAYSSVYKQISSGEPSASAEFRLKGGSNWLRMSLSVIQYDEKGRPEYAVGIVEDITEQKNVEMAYIKEEQYRKALSADTMASYIVNFSQNIFEGCHIENPLCVEARHGEPYESMFMGLAPVPCGADDRRQYLNLFSRGQVLENFKHGKKEFSMEYRVMNASGSANWMKGVLRLLEENGADGLRGFLYFMDIDGQKREELELKRKSEQDSMTGLLNKGAAVDYIEARLQTFEGVQGGVFIMLDVDLFKNINDSYGHPAGDSILIQVADALRENTREGDIVARIGGDEFCVFACGITTITQVKHIALDICNQIRGIQLPGEDGCKVTCSMGISICNGRKKAFQQLYEDADKALYEVKKNGRNGFSISNN